MCWTTTTTSLSPPSTHTHTHPGRFLSPPHVCSSIRAPGISYYMKRELNPFPFFFESNETEHITSNQYTDGREREKPPFRSNSFPALSPHAAAEPSWAGRKSMVTPFFCCRPPLAFHLFFFFAFPLLLLLPICCCAPKELQCNRTSPDLAPPPPRVGPEKHPTRKLMWVENECRNNRAA